MSEFGYAGTIVQVDLSTGTVTRLPTAEYARRFIGGRGIGAKLYWDAVAPETKALDAGNCLIFTTGPLAGFPRLAGSRWQVCGKSPAREPEAFSYGNLGGSWGVTMKFAGYDALIIKGKATKPVYLAIRDGAVELRDATALWGKTAFQTREQLKTELGKTTRVLTIGPAGENLVVFATMLADDDATASCGFGSVMGAKNLKAIVVCGDHKPVAAQPEKLAELADHILKLRKGTWEVYTPVIPGKTKPQACWGCISGCVREVYTAETGEHAKFFCQASDIYRREALKYYGGWNDVIFHATRLCNDYGLDTAVIQPIIGWLARCQQNGILTDASTGIPISKLGSAEFIETLTRKIALREGFGDILAQGTTRAAAIVGKGAVELIGESITSWANELTDYDPRLYITTGLLYAFEPRRPIQQLHEITQAILEWLSWTKSNKNSFLSTEILLGVAEKFWGSRIAADFSTYEGKALAAKVIQDREYAKESLILCDFLWPVIWVRFGDNHVGDPTLESQVFSAVTGRETDEMGLYRLGERIFNLQRAILLREGWEGRQGDRLRDFIHAEPLQSVHFNRNLIMPGKDGEQITRKGMVLEKTAFEEMKDELYQLRGWDVASGFPTQQKLVELELNDVAEELGKRGLVR